MMCTVHMEGGWDREGVDICRAEVYCPHGGRVGQRGVNICRAEVYYPRGGRGGTERGGTERGEHPQR